MNLFTTKREMWLWLWALATLVAIYTTLGVVPRLVGILGETALTALFWLGLILVMITILSQGLNARPQGIEIGVGLGITAVYLLVALRFTIPAERSHLIEYSVVATFIYEALKERAKHIKTIRYPAIIALSITILLGWLDEGIQAILPNRHYANVDVLFNTLAAFMAIIGNVILTNIRRYWSGND